jgi:nicotinic acid mononucleotide adenylyltransferase
MEESSDRMYERSKHYMLVYGLSANPPHQSHVDLIVEAVKALVARMYPIAMVILVPVYRRNLARKHKEDLPQTFENRFALCRLAAEEMAKRLAPVGIPVEVSRIEEQLARSREQPNFTLETLSIVQAAAPDTGLVFLLSSDIVSGDEPELARWHQPEKLVQLTSTLRLK